MAEMSNPVDVMGRELPYSQEAELAVIGSALTLRASDPLPMSCAEKLGRFGQAPGLAVPHEGRDAAAGRRDDADDHTHNAAPQIDKGIAAQVFQLNFIFVYHVDGLFHINCDVPVYDHGQQLRYGINADDGGNRREAGEQAHLPKGKSGVSILGVHADTAKQQADDAADQALDNVFRGECCDNGQAKDGQAHIFL